MLALRLQGLTYQEIGGRFHISRQRVQQILSPSTVIRRIVVKHYNGACASCGLHVGNKGHIHHKSSNDTFEAYNDLDNLELFCLSCHMQQHGNIQYEQIEEENVGKVKFLRLEEVAVYLGQSYMQVRSLISNGLLKATRVGIRGIRVSEDEVERYLESLAGKEK